MAGHQEIMEHWSTPPEPRMRIAKSQMEEELLIKLGAKKEVVSVRVVLCEMGVTVRVVLCEMRVREKW